MSLNMTIFDPFREPYRTIFSKRQLSVFVLPRPSNDMSHDVFWTFLVVFKDPARQNLLKIT